MVDVQRNVAEACNGYRRYECKFADRRLRNEWRGCECGCVRTVPGDLEERLRPRILEGMQKGYCLTATRLMEMVG